MPIFEITPELHHAEDPNLTENSYVPKGVYFFILQGVKRGKERRKRGHLKKKKKSYPRHYYLGSLGDLLARLIFGDFFAAQSSLSSISLESEQLQLSITVEIKLFP